MSLLEGNQFQGGGQLLHASIGFSPGAGTSVSGNDGGNPVGTLPGLSLFYVHGLGEDVKVGLGVFSNFGLGMNYSSGWVGRYYALDNTLIGVSIMPGLSYRINEYLSIGAAANVMVGYLKYSAAINNQLPARWTLQGIESSSITMRGLYHSHSSSAKAAVTFLTL